MSLERVEDKISLLAELTPTAEKRLHLLFTSHVLLQVLLQWLDLLATKRMIAENGLNYEANKIAQFLFTHDPQVVDIAKIMVVPSLVLLSTVVAHHSFFKRKHLFTHAGFEHIPFRLLKTINVGMTICLIIIMLSDELGHTHF